jgi:DNA-binding MarR family transcriptional regulator
VARTTSPARVDTRTVGFLLAKASQRFNERLAAGFAEHGFPEVRPSYGSVLVPLFEQDGLRLGELAARARLSKQAITGLVKLCEDDGLVVRERDPDDGRAFRLRLSERGRDVRAVAEAVAGELEDELVRSLGNDDYQALERALKGVMDL